MNLLIPSLLLLSPLLVLLLLLLLLLLRPQRITEFDIEDVSAFFSLADVELLLYG